jgi:cell division protein FtsN
MRFSLFDKFSFSFIEGKGLLITIIIVFSSVSFMIGFFAGKKLNVSETGLEGMAKSSESPDSNSIKIEEKKADVQAIYTESDAAPDKSSERAAKVDRASVVPKTQGNENTPKPSSAQPVAKETIHPEALAGSTEKSLASTTSTVNVEEKQSPAIEGSNVDSAARQPKPGHTTSHKNVPETKKTEKHKPRELKVKQIEPPPADEVQPAAKQAKSLKTGVAGPGIKGVDDNPSAPPEGGVHGRSQVTRVVQPEQKQIITAPRKSPAGRFFIQVGAFKSIGEAMRLQEQLGQMGFDANISKHSISDGVTLYKIRLGNYSREEANQTLSKLNKKGVKGFVREE